jgi:hypothetical protein
MSIDEVVGRRQDVIREDVKSSLGNVEVIFGAGGELGHTRVAPASVTVILVELDTFLRAADDLDRADATFERFSC